MTAYSDCLECRSPIRTGETTCPFCDANQRTAGSPSWLLVSALVGLGLGPVACDGDDGESTSSVSETSTSSSTSTTSDDTTSTTSDDTTTSSTSDDTSTSSTTTPPDDSTSSTWGSTYAGPDEDSSAWDLESAEFEPEPELDSDHTVNDGHSGRRLRVVIGSDSAAH